MELISKQEAKQQGKVRYFTGLLCKNNHISQRYVSTNQCASCVSESRDPYIPVVKSVHPRTAAKLANSMVYNTGVSCSHGHFADRYTSTGQCTVCHSIYYDNEHQKQKKQQYTLLNKDKKAAYDREFSQKNKAYRSALKSANRAKRKLRLVSWDKEFTDFVAEEAFHLCELRKDATGFAWHMDHVIPLNGKAVSGLHVWNNFAVIPASQNLSKGNRYTMETLWH